MIKIIIFSVIFLISNGSGHPRILSEISYNPSILSIPLSKFSFNLMNQLSESSDGKENIFLSPLSISMAFSMLLLGSRGPTEEIILKTLKLEQNPDVHQTFQEILYDYKSVEIGRSPRNFSLSLGNLVMVQDSFPVEPTFKTDLQINYFASVAEVDFTKNGHEIVEKINKWVQSRTGNMIKRLLSEPLDETTKLVLLNAIFFKGAWSKKFDHQLTQSKPFYSYGVPGATSEVEMMYQENYYPYAHIEDKKFKLLELPFEGNMSMVILLPDEIDGLEKVTRSFGAEELLQILKNGMTKRLVEVSLPKFKIESEVDLKRVLVGLGMEMPFTPSANLSGISTAPGLYVSKAVHKAVIEIDEEGGKAAGATGLVIRPLSLTFGNVFRVDRPFMFFIRDNANDVMLFIGKVNKL